MKEDFVLELPLQVEKYQADILNKRYEQLRQLYNYVQGKLLRQYRYFEQMDEYRNCNNNKEKASFFKKHTFQINGILGRNKESLDISFSEYGISGFVSKLGKKAIGAGKTYSDTGISSTILANLSSNIWSAWNKKLYDSRTKKISFKKYGMLNTFGSGKVRTGGIDYFPGMVLRLDSMELDIKTNGKTGSNSSIITLPIMHNPKHADYEMMALKGGIESVKVLAVVRRLVRGQYKYYVQLTIEGEKPQKGRTLGKGNVGIDLGPTTVAVSGENVVSIDKLASRCDNIQAEITRLSRKIDRSRRANNPDNYNEDGTIKRGVKLVWKKEKDLKRYSKLKRELAELRRRQSAIRKHQHIERANALLKEGDTFIIENNPTKAWGAKKKETKIDERTGKYKSKKGHGKSIGNHAPSMFVDILKNKVKSLGGRFEVVETRNAASQYDFTDGSFTDHGYDRKITLSNGDTHQRDMLAAFNLQHLKLDATTTKQYDTEAMAADYDRFCQLEREEIMRYKKKEKRDDRSTIGAEKL
jgi:hypothetical protein